MIYAVIDTNVLVSALITKNPEAATAKVVRLLLEQGFIPMYDANIIEEYDDVLHRSKFPILPEVADTLKSPGLVCLNKRVSRYLIPKATY